MYSYIEDNRKINNHSVDELVKIMVELGALEENIFSGNGGYQHIEKESWAGLARYGKIHNEFYSKLHENIQEQILANLPRPETKKTILLYEIGCGKGLSLLSTFHAVKKLGYDVIGYGIDFNEENVRLANEEVHNNQLAKMICFKQEDAKYAFESLKKFTHSYSMNTSRQLVLENCHIMVICSGFLTRNVLPDIESAIEVLQNIYQFAQVVVQGSIAPAYFNKQIAKKIGFSDVIYLACHDLLAESFLNNKEKLYILKKSTSEFPIDKINTYLINGDLNLDLHANPLEIINVLLKSEFREIITTVSMQWSYIADEEFDKLAAGLVRMPNLMTLYLNQAKHSQYLSRIPATLINKVQWLNCPQLYLSYTADHYAFSSRFFKGINHTPLDYKDYETLEPKTISSAKNLIESQPGARTPDADTLFMQSNNLEQQQSEPGLSLNSWLETLCDWSEQVYGGNCYSNFIRNKLG